MAKKTISQMRNEVRENLMKKIMEFLEKEGYEVLPYKGNAFSVPDVLENGDEIFQQMTFSIPTGARDGSQFDGYEAHEDYLLSLEEKRIKEKAAAAKKEKEQAERKAKQENAKRKKEENRLAREARKEGGMVAE